jgi:hypothetical protein
MSNDTSIATLLAILRQNVVDNLLSCVVRPNRVQITPEIYSARAARWSRHWPFLRLLSWEDGVGEAASQWVNPVPEEPRGTRRV